MKYNPPDTYRVRTTEPLGLVVTLRPVAEAVGLSLQQLKTIKGPTFDGLSYRVIGQMPSERVVVFTLESILEWLQRILPRLSPSAEAAICNAARPAVSVNV